MLGRLTVGEEKTRYTLAAVQEWQPNLWVQRQGQACMAHAAAEASLGMQKLLQGWISRCFPRVI